jgi:hypothetical protein
MIWYSNGAVALVGFFGFALLPIALDFAVELTYPVSESVVVGLVMCVEQAFSLIFSIIGSFLIEGRKEEHSGVKIAVIIYCLALLIASFTAVFFLKEDLKRIKF